MKTLEQVKGKEVIGISGAMYPKRYGVVVGEVKPQYGFESWVIEWEDGTKDFHSKHTLVDISERKSIGVFFK